MAKNSEDAARTAEKTTESPAGGVQRVQFSLRLQPANNSDQPLFANFSMLQPATGIAFIDFGFLEPGALSALARTLQGGGKAPETVNGRLACRVALTPDVAAQLAQQLNDWLRSLAPRPAAAEVAGAVAAPAAP